MWKRQQCRGKGSGLGYGSGPWSDLCPTLLALPGKALPVFSSNPVMPQQFLPDRAAQKPGNIPLCQGIWHSDPAAWHLAGIQVGPDPFAYCENLHHHRSTQAGGNRGTSLCQHKAEGSQAPPRNQFLPQHMGSAVNPLPNPL